ncbi:MAG: hypothetical protein IKE56_00185 [Lachnospiraceae bacterium]|nr:hypothetical protein [Lachnospiraceae bacterium]
MKALYNTMIHGIGYLFFMVGFILCMGAAGLADNNGVMNEITHYAIAGMASCLGGLFLIRWRV